MIRLCFCLALLGCSQVNTPRTIQQKNLIPASLNDITEAVTEEDAGFEADVSYPRNRTESLPDPKFRKKISLSVSSTMPLRNVFIQMSKLAGVNIFVAPDVEGIVSFDAEKRPFIDILDDICSSCNLKYNISGNSVKIENDTPFTKIYDLQFLNIQRETQSSVSVSTDAFNQSITEDGSGIGTVDSKDNGSSSVVSGVIKNDFWSEIEQNLKDIVGEDGKVSVHRQGGVITVQATQEKHKQIGKYIDLLRESVESQVLIEAKILEVNLSDEYKNGINWNILRSGGATLVKNYPDRAGMISFGLNRNNLNIIEGLIERFGAVKTLSSPRITVLNNQSAILKVARNEIIYTPQVQHQYGTSTNTRDSDFFTTTLHSIPIGLIMSVQPSIDLKTNTVILNLRPTVSRVNGYREVPYIYQTSSQSTSSISNQSQKIPILDVREMDSVLKLRSGQVAIMGGLMRERSNNNRNGLPGFSELDIIAGENEKKTEVTELVIFLKATILRGRGYHAADRKLYDKYANDPRPLAFTGKEKTPTQQRENQAKRLMK